MNVVKANIPWSMKLGYVIANWFCTEDVGFEGHAGPAINPNTTRTEFGASFWWNGTSEMTDVRIKWK